jgi:methylated-DNA-protein-cysteine methyltransferase-like protein
VSKKGKPGLFDLIYRAVSNIPYGKVATYGQVAKVVGIKDARKVGWALHVNKKPETPCHRMVNREGRVAVSFAFGGREGQKKRLRSEGITFKDAERVNLNRHLWNAQL